MAKIIAGAVTPSTVVITRVKAYHGLRRSPAMISCLVYSPAMKKKTVNNPSAARWPIARSRCNRLMSWQVGVLELEVELGGNHRSPRCWRPRPRSVVRSRRLAHCAADLDSLSFEPGPVERTVPCAG